MPIYENRKFIRIKTNLYAIVNRQLEVAIKALSLGGCLIESSKPIPKDETIRIDFNVGGQHLSLLARLVDKPRPNQIGLKFLFEATEQTLLLKKVIEETQANPSQRTPARVAVEAKAIVNRETAVVSNISEGGCFIKMKNQYVLGNVVDVRFQLGDHDLHFSSQVRWQDPSGIGVEFLSPDPEMIQVIANYVLARAKRY